MNFTQNSVIALIGKIAGSFLALLTSILLARALGPKGVGQYQLIISAQTVLITIFAMGFGNASIYFINSNKFDKKKIISNLANFFVIISLVLSILFFILLSVLKEYFGILSFNTYILLSISISGLLITNILKPSLYTDFKILRIEFINLSSSIILVLGILYFYFFDKITVDIGLSIYSVGVIVAFIFTCIFLKEFIVFPSRIEKKIIKELFIYGIKISATNLIFILASNIIIFIMKQIMGDNGFVSVGLYSRATAVANIIYLVPSTIGPLLYSRWSKVAINNLHKEVEKTLRILIFFTTITIILLSVFSEIIIELLYGIEFIKAKEPLIIMLLAVFFSSIVNVFTNVFSSIGKPLVTLRVFSTSLILTSLSSLILIKMFGINGGALSVLLGSLYNAVILVHHSKKEIHLNLNKSLLIKRSDMKEVIRTLRK